MRCLTLAIATGLLVQGCGSERSMPARADAGGSGGGGASGGANGSGGGGGRGGSAAGGSAGGAGAGDARGLDMPLSSDTRVVQDGATTDAPASTIKPPIYPPPGMGTCAPGCAELRVQYAEAVLRAQRCSVGAQNACAHKAPGSLGCGGCGVWVSDLSEVAPIYNRFNEQGCYGCFFDGAEGQKRCHAIACADLEIPICAPQGSCTNMAKDRTCPPGLMTGTPCTNRPDYCTGGSQMGCYCSATSPTWTCLR